MTLALLLTPWIALQAPPRGADAPTAVPDAAPPGSEPVVEDSPATPPSAPVDPGMPGPYRDAPAVPEREGYVDGPIPTTSPPGSRRGEQREGEVWRPIQPNNYTGPQKPPSEAAVAGQGNTELGDSLKQKKKPAAAGSPQRFMLEVKFGPYLPDVDRNYNGEGFGPYARIYGETDDTGRATGEPKKGFYGAIAFEYQIVNLAGPLGVGFQWSMFRDKAQALLAEEPADPEASVRSAADSTRFSVMPLALQAVYRFELLADRFKVPLVPYGKVGLNYSFWWSKNGAGDIATIKDETTGEVIDKARGGAWGYQFNVGGMLRLDFLERGVARSLDRATGINHTYVFGEWQFSRVNNFGRKDSISLGDSTWLVGLAIEF
ncbi:MAG: hypothetical protein JNL82_20385 [Myxococcales bacterium]|nr:hypothetical protein [Myxococcales bacterium]